MGFKSWLRDGRFSDLFPQVKRSRKRKSAAKLFLEGLERRIAPASITWTGDGDGKSWTNAKNWTGDVVPGASDSAIIDAPGTTVTYSGGGTSVLSVNSEANLVIS